MSVLLRKTSLFLLLLIETSLSAACLSRENIPSSVNAPNILPFAMQKDPTDGSLSSKFLEKLKQIFAIDTFIETGTYLGNTTEKASKIFATVHTIEISHKFHTLAINRFKNTAHVNVHLGDAGKILGTILPSCSHKTLFYLDGHYDGGYSGKGEKNTPIFEELKAIKAWEGASTSVIIIDDICDFQESLYPQLIEKTCFADYPNLETLVDAILAICPEYQICFIPNALLIFPPTTGVSISPLLRACTIDRLSTISNLFSEEELLDVEKTIGCIQGQERIALENYFQSYSDLEWNFGWRSFASFWMGLILYHEQKTNQANHIFKLTAQHSLPGWRIDTYAHKNRTQKKRPRHRYRHSLLGYEVLSLAGHPI